jgi:predicted transposase YbfD/YdcC
VQEQRNFLCSTRLSAQAFARAVRAHWGVENRLHWVLGVIVHDDLAWLRSGFGPENMAVVKHMAMNLLRSPRNSHQPIGGINLKRFARKAARRGSHPERHGCCLISRV